jgi:hypothetical protein
MAKLRRIDIGLEDAGVWKTHPDGWSVRVRSSNSPRVLRILGAAFASKLGEVGGKTLALADQERAAREVYAREVLIDWKDIDEAPAYSTESALKFMTDPELRGFQEFVVNASADVDAFERKGGEAILGNSLAGSNGN